MAVPRCVSVACRKGGVAKTTTAIAIASWLAARGHRTALVELDDQGNAAYSLGCDLDVAGSSSLLLGNPAPPQEVASVPGLVVYAGTSALQGGDIADLDPEQLADMIKRHVDADWVVIDSPPKGIALELMGLIASEVCLIPINPHPLAVNGALRIHKAILDRRERDRAAPGRVALVPTKIDQRRVLDRSLFESLGGLFPDIALFAVRSDETVAQDMADQVSFVAQHPDCRASADYKIIADWILSA